MRLITLSGPRGAGKGAVGEQLLKRFMFLRRVPPCTTREPRPGERDGVEYFFLSQEEFWRQVDAGDFAFHQYIGGTQWSGTRWCDIEGVRAALSDITPEGARTLSEVVRERGGQTLKVFLHAPPCVRRARALRRHPGIRDEQVERLLAEDPVNPDPAQYGDFDLIVENREGELTTTVHPIAMKLVSFFRTP